ncbi:hypothetical protein [Streptomyces sp. NWU339]|uniref:hypothetical protein n=1 Tax=Streptomyces sp. NWU339 TaxID=2185284 RepID=UPI0011B4887F|nr:hypothetical protein [Streptomyces sp. NWU339]
MFRHYGHPVTAGAAARVHPYGVGRPGAGSAARGRGRPGLVVAVEEKGQGRPAHGVSAFEPLLPSPPPPTVKPITGRG